MGMTSHGNIGHEDKSQGAKFMLETDILHKGSDGKRFVWKVMILMS